MRKILIILLLFHFQIGIGQNFNFQYGSTTFDSGIDIIEDYDKGYVVLSTLDGNYARIMLTKIDVNGDVLWQKIIGNVSDKIAPTCIIQTEDNGFLLTGVEHKYDPPPPGGNSFAMKLNECGEIEWTKSYGSYGNYDFIIKAVQTDDKGFALLANLIDNKRIVLLKIDSIGRLEFKKHFFDTSNASGWSLTKCMNGDLLFSGYGYFPNPGGIPAGLWYRGVVGRIDKYGNEKWHHILGMDTLLFSTHAYCTELPDSSIICGAVWRASGSSHIYKPYFFKLDKDGNLLWRRFLGDTTGLNTGVFGFTTADTNKIFVLSGKFIDPGGYKGVFLYKTDTSGAFIDTVSHDSQYTCWPGNLKAISNHKLIYCGTQDNGGNYQAQIIRFREDLCIDTVLNIQLTYDSLCGHAIPAIEYLPFDTNYHVGVGEVINQPKEMKIFPNPASSSITIEMPQLEHDAEILIFNSIGEVVVKQRICKTESDVMIDIARLQVGIYFVKVDGYSGKFVKE
ncbi:MAG: T9SS type A sorting domain-containing protein [Bacteroidota bacterium]